MKTFTLKRSVWIPHPIDEVFSFFSDPKNIPSITPKWVRFQNVGNGRGEMKVGTQFEHRIKVKGVLPVRWISEITEWDPPYGFVDEQKSGPYRFWRHEHVFEESKGGTLVGDIVRYSVLGGDFLNRWLIAPDLKKIFDYRRESVRRIFSQSPVD